MKPMKYIHAILPCMLLLSACDSFLDDAPRGKTIAGKVEDYNAMFNSAALMNIDLSIADYAFWKSDEHLFDASSIAAISQLGPSYAKSVESAFRYEEKVYRDDENCLAWEQGYRQIYTYNAIANGVRNSAGAQETKDYLEAEARVTRAYIHFLLAQWFAMPYDPATAATELAVPIVTKADTQKPEYTRATVKELYDFVTGEMETWCPELEERGEHRLRVYKATGYAMLGKVYWMMGEYGKAIAPLKKAKELLAGDPTIKLYDYNATQMMTGYMELPPMMIAALGIVPYLHGSSETLYCKQNVLMYGVLSVMGGPTHYLKPEFYALYDAKDLRRNLISVMEYVEFMPVGLLPAPFAGMASNGSNYGISLPEVYLMLAESEARAGSETEARSVIEAFRKNRMRTGFEAVPAGVVTKNDLIRFCVDEQTREFVATGHRWYNIRRLWNDPLFQDMKPITHTDADGIYILKQAQLKLEIPKTVMIWNENWK